MEHSNKYAAIGQFIHGYQRLQLLVDELLDQLQVPLPHRAGLGEKMLCLETAIEQLEPVQTRSVIGAFVQQMRLMETMNVPLNDFADMQDADTARYARQAQVGHHLAEAVRASLTAACGKHDQAPPA